MPLRLRILSLAALTLAMSTAVSAVAQAKAPTYKPMKGSEILWDKWGVPHIFGKNTKDMFYLYGYAQTEAHGELLMHVMAGSRGRSSEIYGAGLNDRNLKTDRWVWLNEVPKRSELWLTQQTPEFRGYLEAFAAGINAYAAAHPDKLTAEAKQVLPITPLDVIAHATLRQL